MYYLISYRKKFNHGHEPVQHLTVQANTQGQAATAFRRQVYPNTTLQIVGIRPDHEAQLRADVERYRQKSHCAY